MSSWLARGHTWYYPYCHERTTFVIITVGKFMEYKYANTTDCHYPQHKICRLLFCSNFTVALRGSVNHFNWDKLSHCVRRNGLNASLWCISGHTQVMTGPGSSWYHHLTLSNTGLLAPVNRSLMLAPLSDPRSPPGWPRVAWHQMMTRLLGPVSQCLILWCLMAQQTRMDESETQRRHLVLVCDIL